MRNSLTASRVVPDPDQFGASNIDRARDEPARCALTLVEMLVGMAITLVMMAAVVNLFANISEGIRNRRATMEVSASLRIARARLYNDLAGATCLKYPKDAFGVMPKPDVNNPPDGYFEIVEGRWSDENPSGLVQDGVLNTPNGLDTEVSLVPRANDGQLVQWNDQNNNGRYDTGEPILSNTSALGDYDDILAMTVESTTERFRGKGRGLCPGGNPAMISADPGNPIVENRTNPTGDWVDMAISSPVAEVVWYSTQNPPDRSQGEPGMRKIYRRVVLVAPWYGSETKMIGGTPTPGSDPLLDLTNTTDYPSFASRLIALRDFQNKYDISVRLENQRLVPNTLADLARREFRFAHMTNPADYPGTSAGFYPYQFPYATEDPPSGNFRQARFDNSSLYPFGSENQPGDPSTSERSGEDLVLTDVLAFDVQVYDPGAPLYEYGGSIIQPSGSLAFNDPNSTNDAIGSGVLTGFGTYADLGWNNGNPPLYISSYQYSNILAAIPTAPRPLFQQERLLGWLPGADVSSFRGSPAVYDTWTTYYETDGVDQDNRDGDNNVLTGADEGTNGLDDRAPYNPDEDQSTPPVWDTINGPDDPGERETSPPYPYPLKGVQVKLRVYEPESRQIRETTVTRNLEK